MIKSAFTGETMMANRPRTSISSFSRIWIRFLKKAILNSPLKKGPDPLRALAFQGNHEALQKGQTPFFRGCHGIRVQSKRIRSHTSSIRFTNQIFIGRITNSVPINVGIGVRRRPLGSIDQIDVSGVDPSIAIGVSQKSLK